MDFKSECGLYDMLDLAEPVNEGESMDLDAMQVSCEWVDDA